jgi:hypothetical protein
MPQDDEYTNKYYKGSAGNTPGSLDAASSSANQIVHGSPLRDVFQLRRLRFDVDLADHHASIL